MEPSSANREAPGRPLADGPPHGWDERHLARLARAQDAVVTLRQLSDLGLTRDARLTRIAQHRLVVVHRGVYAVGGVPLTEAGRYRAAVWACDGWALLSHVSAARLLGIWEPPAPELHVTVPRPRRPRHRAVTVHQTGVLLPADETHVRGIPCTSVARTLVDLAGTQPAMAVEAAFERAERQRLVRPAAIEDLLRRKRRTPGAGLVRDLLTTHRPRDGVTRSLLERRVLAGLRRASLPDPVVNGRLEMDGVITEPDLMWPGERVLVELDGGATHATRRAMRRDRGRDRRALRHGWVPLRFTWDDVELDLPGVLHDIREALGRQGRDRAPHGA